MKVEEKIREFSEDYKKSKDTFDSYCKTVAYIIKSLLEKHSFQYQVVSNRVKRLESIEGKLIGNSLPKNVTSLNEIDDIIGCRVIFYLESDIQRFENLIYNEFIVKKRNMRYSEDGYNAVHLVVKLTPERLELMEYESFNGLKCEIQLTTVLFHSWSEMSHNIIYKLPKELTEFDKRSVDALKKEFGEVMKNHIKPASYSFEFINERFEKLKQGKEIFDLEFLQSILFATSRNEIYEKMKLIYQFLNEFGDKTPSGFNLIDFIPEVIQKSHKLETTNIDTGLGSIFGFEHHHVVGVSLDILNQIRYFHVEKTLNILMILAQDENQKIRDKSFEILNNLSRYNLKVMEKIGYALQLQILNKIKNIPVGEKKKVWTFLNQLFLNLLSLEFDDYSLVNYNELHLQFGAIGVNDHLKELRKSIINLLKEIFTNSNEHVMRVDIIKLLAHAMHLPNRGEFGVEIEELVLENTVDIMDWLLHNLEHFDLQEMKALEENIFKSNEKLTKFDELKSLIESDETYDIFKTLVGYDRSYNREIGWREVREIRKNKRKKYLEDMSLENYEDWERRILSIAQCYPVTNDGEFANFKAFLFDLGKSKTNIAIKIVSRNEENLENFLSNIVAGIISSEEENSFGNELISTWLSNKKYLEQCANIYVLTNFIDKKMMNHIFESAVEINNTNALYSLLQAILNKEQFYQQLSDLFIKIIKELSNYKHLYWTNLIWFDENSILNFLTESDFNEILSCLEKVPTIGLHEEEVLIPICKNYPEKIISFFEKRVNIKVEKQSKGANQLVDSFEVVPYKFNDLDELLKDKSETILPLLTQWFNKESWIFQREASHLIKNIFPDFEEPLQDYLNKLIASGDMEDANRVLEIIKEYNGSFKTHTICKNLIKKHGKDEKLMQKVMHTLTLTGVLFGERGHIIAYQQIKKEIRKWEKINNQEIKKFARKFITYIQPMIVEETKRADENVEMMKRRFSNKGIIKS